jgi:hypothetical protein
MCQSFLWCSRSLSLLGSCTVEVVLDWNKPKLNSLDNFYECSIWFYQNGWVVEKMQPPRYALILCRQYTGHSKIKFPFDLRFLWFMFILTNSYIFRFTVDNRLWITVYLLRPTVEVPCMMGKHGIWTFHCLPDVFCSSLLWPMSAYLKLLAAAEITSRGPPETW